MTPGKAPRRFIATAPPLHPALPQTQPPQQRSRSESDAALVEGEEAPAGAPQPQHKPDPKFAGEAYSRVNPRPTPPPSGGRKAGGEARGGRPSFFHPHPLSCEAKGRERRSLGAGKEAGRRAEGRKRRRGKAEEDRQRGRRRPRAPRRRRRRPFSPHPQLLEIRHFLPAAWLSVNRRHHPARSDRAPPRLHHVTREGGAPARIMSPPPARAPPPPPGPSPVRAFSRPFPTWRMASPALPSRFSSGSVAGPHNQGLRLAGLWGN